jgi:hypothetical protein
VALEKPLRYLVHDGAARPAQLSQAREDAVDEGAQIRGQVTARVPLEATLLALFGIEVRGVLGQPQDM